MRSKIKQFLIYLLQILIFALLSIAFMHFVIKSGEYDLMMLYVASATLFVFWLLSIIFKLKFFQLIYKATENMPDPEPPSLAGVMGAQVLCYEDAAKRFPKLVRGLLCVSYITLVIGIVVALSICLYNHSL